MNTRIKKYNEKSSSTGPNEGNQGEGGEWGKVLVNNLIEHTRL